MQINRIQGKTVSWSNVNTDQDYNSTVSDNLVSYFKELCLLIGLPQ